MIRPLLTEKTMKLSINSWYTFAVDRHTTKSEIGALVKRVYSVDPIEVRTIVMKGKNRRVGKKRIEKKQIDWKKAMVKLKKGQTIDAFTLSGQEEKSKK